MSIPLRVSLIVVCLAMVGVMDSFATTGSDAPDAPEIEALRQDLRELARDMREVAPLIPEIVQELRAFHRNIAPVLPEVCSALLVDPATSHSRQAQAARQACERLKSRLDHERARSAPERPRSADR